MATVGSSTSGSLIDVSSLVSQLMQIEQRPLGAMQVKEAGFQAKLTAYGQLKGALSAIGSSLSSLAKADTFQKARATSSDSTVVTASANAAAVAGNYQIEVTNLAQQHKLATSALTPYTATTSAVGTGTLTIQFGTYNDPHTSFTANPDKATKTISIASGSDTLAGVRDAINAANAGVSAAIVNDGSGYRLVTTSTESGAANAIKITVADNDGDNSDASGLSALAYDPAGLGGSRMSEVAQAKSALVQIDGLAITSSTNSLTAAIEGVTLNLVKANPGVKSNISVNRDNSAVSNSISTFVKTFNESAKLVKSLTDYDPTTTRAGTLQGDATARGAMNELRRTLSAPLAAATGDYTRLSDIGISFDTKGQMTLDSTRLNNALAADPAKVSRLLALSGQGTDARVQYVRASSGTKAGVYPISISQAATHGTVAGDGATGLTITAGVNDSLTVNIDGRSGTLTLPAQTYASAAALATDLQTRINGLTDLNTNGSTVKLTQSAGVLTLGSDKYGSSSSASVSGTAAALLFGVAPTATAGVDIAGTINALDATGSGQDLSSSVGNSKGLAVKVNATGLGAYGSVNYFEGYASKLTTLIDSITSSTGTIQSRTDGISRSIKNLTKDQTALQRRLVDIERRYRNEYVALDGALQSMQSTSSYLTQQLASLNARTR